VQIRGKEIHLSIVDDGELVVDLVLGMTRHRAERDQALSNNFVCSREIRLRQPAIVNVPITGWKPFPVQGDAQIL